MLRLAAFLSRHTKPRAPFDPPRALRLPAGRQHKLRRRSLFLEQLEDRRLLAGVMLDPSFNDLATPGYTIRQDHGSGDLLIDPSDGGIIEVNRIEIQRYNADGVFQWNIATGQLSDEGSFAGTIRDADGGILVVGTVDGHSYTAPGIPGGIVHDNLGIGTTHDIAVLRYNSDGTLDTSFGGGDGIAVVDYPSWSPSKRNSGGVWVPILANTSDDYASAINIDQAGNIVVTGTSYTRDVHTLVLYPNGPDGTPYLSPSLAVTSAFSVARLKPDGTPDTTFGDDMFRDGVRDGTVLTYPAADYQNSNYWQPGLGDTEVAIDSDNRIIMAGTASTQDTASADFGLLRYTATGELDDTFGGSNGFVSVNVLNSDFYGSASRDEVVGMARDSQGRIVVLGRSISNSLSEQGETQEEESIVLVRFTADGILDEDFGVAGRATVTTGLRYENDLLELAIDLSDRIVVVGYTQVDITKTDTNVMATPVTPFFLRGVHRTVVSMRLLAMEGCSRGMSAWPETTRHTRLTSTVKVGSS